MSGILRGSSSANGQKRKSRSMVSGERKRERDQGGVQIEKKMKRDARWIEDREKNRKGGEVGTNERRNRGWENGPYNWSPP